MAGFDGGGARFAVWRPGTGVWIVTDVPGTTLGSGREVASVEAASAAAEASAGTAAGGVQPALPAADSQPPTAPTGLTKKGAKTSTISVSWAASSDDVGVSGYGRYRGGSLVSAGSGTSYTYTGLACGTSYTLSVDATDAAGNHSPQATLTASTSACPTSAPANTLLPTISGTTQVGQLLTATNGTWAGTTPLSYTYQWRRCDAAGANCTTISGATSPSYLLASADVGHTLRIVVTATNTAGQASAVSTPTAQIPPTAAGEYFGTLGVGTVVPRSDADCTSRVTRNPWEPRPENNVANHTVPSGPVPWNNSPGWTYWSAFIAKRNRVTGNFTGTTDEIIQWGACKWGIDENLIRAQAVIESYWQQATKGDFEGGKYRSFGLLQVRHDDATGALVKGGYPNTLQNTALNVDYYGAEMRACFEGDFWDGGGWLYGGSQVKGDLWGCVGYWYSGNWYDAGANNYIAGVRNYYNTKPWVGWGYPGK